MSGLGNKEIMAKNIKYYMDLNNKERIDLCNDLGFNYSTLADWVNAVTYPRIDKIELMANYFKIEKSDLIENKSETKEKSYYMNEETREIAQEIFENKDMRMLFDIARNTQPERLKAYAEFLKQMQEKEQ